MPADSPTAAPKNGKGTGKVRLASLADLDQRTYAARRVRALMEGIETDLGGADYLSTGQRQLAQRAALLSAVLEHQEARWLEAGEIDLEEYTRGLNGLARILGMLGLERRARDVTTTALDYVKAHGERGAA